MTLGPVKCPRCRVLVVGVEGDLYPGVLFWGCPRCGRTWPRAEWADGGRKKATQALEAQWKHDHNREDRA